MILCHPLEGRTLFAFTALVTGTVVDAYRLADRSVAHVPLADRTVYADANRNGRMDRGEVATTTNLSGDYRLPLAAGTVTIRLVERDGWAAAGIDSAAVTITTGTTRVAAGTFSTRMTHPTRIDVLSLYTVAARGGQTTAAAVREIETLFRDANAVFANSDTNVILNAVSIQSTRYVESGSIDDDLDALSDGKGLLSNTPALRKAAAADLVTLFTSGAKTPGDSIGVGWEFDPSARRPSENGYNVVALQEDGAVNDANTLAHEIGHNLGAGHDRANNDGAGVTSYAYGYHYRGSNGRLYQDVMDYGGGVVLPFFSTPDFSWAGKPIGKVATADNARIIRLEAPRVAAYA